MDNQPLNEVTFAIFDVETTGLSPAYGHRVCEVERFDQITAINLEE